MIITPLDYYILFAFFIISIITTFIVNMYWIRAYDKKCNEIRELENKLKKEKALRDLGDKRKT